MTIIHKIYEFPTFPISKQVFHVPGAVQEGGFTSGGANVWSPDPGGFSRLEIQPSLQINEWEYPISSWLMSKTNGQIFHVRLAPTPQVAWSKRRNAASVTWDDDILWSNSQTWEGDFSGQYTTAALEGTKELVVDLTGVGEVLQPGHVIGHGRSCYKVDEIEYTDNIATVTVDPPLRRDVAVGDPAYLRPWFTGRIINGSEIIQSYDAENNGHIQLNKIILSEVVVP